MTGTNVSGATLIPNAFGLAGFNQHTWTGAWGTVTYWNAFVANLELHGIGRFFDPRLNNAAKFPIAAANGFGDLPHIDPDSDLITKKLPALHFYQLAIRLRLLRKGPTSTQRQQHVATHSSAAKLDVIDVTWNHSGLSQDGIYISPLISASIVSKLTERPTVITRP